MHRHSCLVPLSQQGGPLLATIIGHSPFGPESWTFNSRLFGVVKRSFTQCPWKAHAHRSNIMFQCDSHYRCCACTAEVLKRYGLVVQSPPPPPIGGNRHDIGGRLQRGRQVPTARRRGSEFRQVKSTSKTRDIPSTATVPVLIV